MTPYAPSKLKAQPATALPPEYREELPKRGLLFLVGNLHSTGRRVAIDLDQGSMHCLQRVHFADHSAQWPKDGKRKRLSEPQIEEVVTRANTLWSSDPQFKPARRSKPDLGVTLILVDQGQVKQFNSHEPEDEVHALYERLWQWMDPVSSSKF